MGQNSYGQIVIEVKIVNKCYLNFGVQIDGLGSLCCELGKKKEAGGILMVQNVFSPIDFAPSAAKLK